MARPRLALSLLALEIGVAAAAWLHLLAARATVAERHVVEDVLSTPVAVAMVALALGALIFLGSTAKRERACRALMPLGFLVFVPIHAAFAPVPPFFALVLAPVMTGWAAARLVASVPGRGYPLRGTERAWVGVVAFAILSSGTYFAHSRGLLADLALGFSDVGDYGVRIENTLRGHFMKSYVFPDQPPFFDHWNPGLLALVPIDAVLRKLLPGALFLQLVQAVALGACAPLIFVWARSRLADPLAAALVALGFVLAPAFTHLNTAYSYGFHPVTLALVGLLGAGAAFARGRRLIAGFLIVVAWSFEETVPVATLGAGLALVLARRTRRAGAVLAGASVVYFLLVTRVILPLVNGAPYYQLAKYSHLGESMGAILASPVLRPRAFWGTLLDEATLAFLLTLLAPLLFLPVRRAAWLLAAAPILAFACLRDEPHVKSIVLQYDTTILPWLLAGSIEALRAERPTKRRAFAAGLLVAALGSALLYGDEPFGRAQRPWPRRTGREDDVRAIVDAIAPTESAAATQRLGAHLIATHPEVSIVRDFFVPDAAVFALDLDDAWGLSRTTRAHRIRRDLAERGFGVRVARRELLLLARGVTPPRPRIEPAASQVAVVPGLALLDRRQEGERLLLKWQVLEKTGADWGAIPLDASGHVAGEVVPVGGFARPTWERVPGEVFEEERSTIAPVADLRFFDYLELDAAGRDVVDLVVELR